MTKDELIAQIEEARARMDAAIDRVPSERMEEFALYDLWTTKDLIAHLSYWEKIVVHVAETLLSGGVPWSEEDGVPVDAINAQVLAENQPRSVEDVRADALTVHAAMLQKVSDLSDEIVFTPGYFSWLGENRPFQWWVAINTFEHYAEHLPDLEAWLDWQDL